MRSRYDWNGIIVGGLLVLIGLWIAACADIDVTTHQAVQTAEPCCDQVDSLQREIDVLRFTNGQYKRMIECLRRGDDDCYGGV